MWLVKLLLPNLYADAARYRWLRNQHWSQSQICITKVKYLHIGDMTFSGELLDELCDDNITGVEQ